MSLINDVVSVARLVALAVLAVVLLVFVATLVYRACTKGARARDRARQVDLARKRRTALDHEGTPVGDGWS
jgi:uncharacterized protein HemY